MPAICGNAPATFSTAPTPISRSAFSSSPVTVIRVRPLLNLKAISRSSCETSPASDIPATPVGGPQTAAALLPGATIHEPIGPRMPPPFLSDSEVEASIDCA